MGGHINHVYLSGLGVEISDETSFNSMLSESLVEINTSFSLLSP